MELFYNPERMSETEIKETFVAYQWLVDEIISILKHQPKGAGVQHVVIVAPRGMGKTTMLLMLRFTVLSQDIGKRWQPVLFPEESYSVYDLADLWVEVIDHVASETGDTNLHDSVKTLKQSHQNSAELEPVALASIKDWSQKNKKRLLLLIDNFDMILEQIGNEKDHASLRDVLMNDGTMMFVGGSPTFFKEARAYDQPLYNLFKIYNLDGLNSEQVEDLLGRRAKLDGLENFEDILSANRSRLRVLEYFTGGNPRLVLMLYRVLTHSDISEVRSGLEKLLDEVTPYYKAKIEALPPQQRKILDQIARISAQTREGLTPTEIASATRLAVNQVSAQLKRLTDVGYVRAANIRGRSSYYTLSEPLYAIWHQMRFGRDARTRMQWLITFLKAWYDAKELGIECERLHEAFRSYVIAGRQQDARNALEHRRYLMEAIEDQSSRARTFEGIILGYLELSDVETLKRESLTEADIATLSSKTQEQLVAAGIINKDWLRSRTAHADLANLDAAALNSIAERLRTAYSQDRNDEAVKILNEYEAHLPEDSLGRLLIRAQIAATLKNYDASLVLLEELVEQIPDLPVAWSLKGIALKETAKLAEAAQAFARAVELDSSIENLELLGETWEALKQFEQALSNFDSILEIQPSSLSALYGRARALAGIGRMDEAFATIQSVLSLRPNEARAWFLNAILLSLHGDIDEALKSINRAVELAPDRANYFLLQAWFLDSMKRTQEALISLDRVFELEPNSPDAYFLRATFLVNTDFESRLFDYRRAFELASKSSAPLLLIESFKGKLVKTLISIIDNEPEKQIKSDWQAMMRKAGNDRTVWLEDVTSILSFAAEAGYWKLTRKLIALSNLEEQLFPLARALDFLVTRDEKIIEKLSPEVRTIVMDIVSTLRKQQRIDGANKRGKIIKSNGNTSKRPSGDVNTR